MSGPGLRYIERDSPIHRMDAMSKLLWLGIVAVSLLAKPEARFGSVMLASVLVLTLALARVPVRVFLRSSGLVFGVAFLLGVFHLLATPGEAILRLGPVEASREGFLQGAGFFLRLAVIVLSSFLIFWTTDIHDLMVGLVHVGVPYRFAFALFMALRFLPLVQQEIEAVRAAHAVRGRATRSPLRHRFRLWQRYLFTVVVNGLRKAEKTAMAIEARGFGAYPDRTFVRGFRWTVSGWGLVTAFVVLIAGLVHLEG